MGKDPYASCSTYLNSSSGPPKILLAQKYHIEVSNRNFGFVFSSVLSGAVFWVMIRLQDLDACVVVVVSLI